MAELLKHPKGPYRLFLVSQSGSPFLDVSHKRKSMFDCFRKRKSDLIYMVATSIEEVIAIWPGGEEPPKYIEEVGEVNVIK